MARMGSMLERVGVIADHVLFPAALDVDAEGVIPASHLDLLAEEGCYGLVGPAEHGGSEVDVASFAAIVEALAGGCLTSDDRRGGPA